MIMKQIKNFVKPTQVKFYDIDGDGYIYGIGIGKRIICGCCGGAYDIDEIYYYAPEEITEPIKELPWIDITDAIKGE